MAIVYALVDPRDYQVRYVGMTTKTLKHRLRQHIAQARSYSNTQPVYVWVNELLDLGMKPVIEELEETFNPKKEARWIAEYYNRGAKLLNVVDADFD